MAQITLRNKFTDAPEKFPYYLDEIQDAMMRAEWATIRNKGKFIQSLLLRSSGRHPRSAELSTFMAAIIKVRQSFFPALVAASFADDRSSSSSSSTIRNIDTHLTPARNFPPFNRAMPFRTTECATWEAAN